MESLLHKLLLLHSYQGSDSDISNLNLYEMVLAYLQLGSYSLEAGISADCQGHFKKRRIWERCCI